MTTDRPHLGSKIDSRISEISDDDDVLLFYLHATPFFLCLSLCSSQSVVSTFFIHTYLIVDV